MVKGLDFAVLWDGDWREGRCYASYPERTFITYKDAQRFPLSPGLSVRLPRYILKSERPLELAREYASE